MKAAGSGYVGSIKRLFPQDLQEICISPTEDVCAKLESQEKRYASQYLETLDITDYPYWIGNIEKLEDGVRYIYQTDFNPEKQQILLTKTEYDSGEVKEIYEFNSETGDSVGHPPVMESEKENGSEE